HRKGQLPPASFWAAAANHASPDDQSELGDAAHARGLYRDAAQLHKNAAAHVSLENPYLAAWFLSRLREAGAQEQVTALLRRDPAAHVSLDNLYNVAALLDSLWKAGAQEQITKLARRAAAHAPLDKPGGVGGLLKSLQAAGDQEQAIKLARRAV